MRISLALLLLLAGCSAAPETRQIAPGSFAMIVEPGTEESAIAAAAKAKCGSLQFCSVWAWTDKSDAAMAMPMTDAETGSAVFSYVINRASGHEQALWRCSVYPQADRNLCMG